MVEAGNDYAPAGVKDLCAYVAHMVFNVSCVLEVCHPQRHMLDFHANL